MIKYVLPTMIAAVALTGPALAQTIAPQPMAPAPNMTVNTNATMTGQPQPGPTDLSGYNQANQPAWEAMYSGQPMPGPSMQPGFSPRTVWIPGSYNWDPVRQNYVWSDGQYVEAPNENAQWVSGHWTQTPTSWIWLDGRWM